MPDRWELLDTPNPHLFGFLVRVPQDTVSLYPQLCPEEGDLFQNLGLLNSRSIGWIPDNALAADSRFGLYVYVQKTIDRKTGVVNFHYGPPMTEEKKKTPYRRQWKKFGNHRWPPILKGVAILQDNAFPQSTNYISVGQLGVATASKFYDRYLYVPDTSEGTRFFLEEFFSPTQFVIPRYRTPVATAVQYSVNGLNNSFPECLHDDIDIPATRTANATYLGGDAFAGNGSVEGQFFPKTNFKTWLPYVLSHEQEQVEAGWYGFRIRVFPPLLPRAIRQ